MLSGADCKQQPSLSTSSSQLHDVIAKCCLQKAARAAKGQLPCQGRLSRCCAGQNSLQKQVLSRCADAKQLCVRRHEPKRAQRGKRRTASLLLLCTLRPVAAQANRLAVSGDAATVLLHWLAAMRPYQYSAEIRSWALQHERSLHPGSRLLPISSTRRAQGATWHGCMIPNQKPRGALRMRAG